MNSPPGRSRDARGARPSLVAQGGVCGHQEESALSRLGEVCEPEHEASRLSGIPLGTRLWARPCGE